jgi:hypothetical protein
LKIHFLALAVVLYGGACLLGVQPGVGAPIEQQSGVQFESAKVFPGSVEYPSGLAAGDLNNDGVPDLAVIGTSEHTTPGEDLYISIGNGNGTFQRWYDAPSAPKPFTVTMADMALDGNLDIITSSANEVVVAPGERKRWFL